MASLTIIPYNPIQANAYCSSHHPRTKGISKSISDHDREPRIKPSILPVDMPQPQAIAVANEDSESISDGDHHSPEKPGSRDSACTGQGRDQACGQKSEDKVAPILMDGSEENNDIQIEIDSLFDDTDDNVRPRHDLTTEVDDIFAETDVESKVNGAEVQDSDAEFAANDIDGGMRDNHHFLKRKAKARGQGSKDNPLVIPDSDTEDESDSESESEDELVWKKRKVGQSLVGRHGPWLRMIDETDDEIDKTNFDIDSTRVGTGDTLSENDGVASEIGDSRQSHPSPMASSTQHPDVSSADLVKPQSVARVGGNGEWGIHGIIGKEVIEGKVYYCVDWEPTMIPLDELGGAQRLVREFEVREQARLRTQKKKYRGRPRKQK